MTIAYEELLTIIATIAFYTQNLYALAQTTVPVMVGYTT
jgi:hypothetical protein